MARRDIPVAVARGVAGATTVSATIWAAAKAGITVGATGGIGGVHPGSDPDVSADLLELARTPGMLVCSGPKSIIDPVATTEKLEELGVALVGFGVDRLPFFLAREAPVTLEHRVDSTADAAAILRSSIALETASTVLLCNPVPASMAMDAAEVADAAREAETQADAAGIARQGTHPVPAGDARRTHRRPKPGVEPRAPGGERPAGRRGRRGSGAVVTSAEAAHIRRAAWGGIAGPVGFLALSFLMAALRPEIIRAQGWASWPSSMALGGPPVALVQIGTFLWLTLCYSVFALGALRPLFGWTAAAIGYLVIAVGDGLLAFPTDGPGTGTSWHGTLHLAGVIVVTVATLVAVAGVTIATRDRPWWKPWRTVAWIPFAATLIGMAAGFDHGWAKVTYVVGITAPGAVAGWLAHREPARHVEPAAV